METRRRHPGSSATLPTGAPTTGGGLSAAATLPTGAPATGGGLGARARSGLGPVGRLPIGRLTVGPVPVGLVPVGVGVVLLLAPVLFRVTAPDPVAAAPDQGAGPARPVRVLSYNLHFGFDVRGWSDLGGDGPGH